jgi:hypothetical protein
MNNLRILTFLWVLAAAWTAVLLLVFSWSPEPPPLQRAATALVQYFGPFALVLGSLSIRLQTRAAVYRNLAILGWAVISVAFAVTKADSRTGELINQIANSAPVLIGWYLGPICLFWSLIERAEFRQGRRFCRSGKLQKCGYVVAVLVIAVGCALSQSLLLRGNDGFSEWLWKNEFLAFTNWIVFYLVSLGFFTARGGKRQGFLIGLAVILVAAGGVISEFRQLRMDSGFRPLSRMRPETEPFRFDRRDSGFVVAAIFATWSILPLWLMLWVIDWTASRGLSNLDTASETHDRPRVPLEEIGSRGA